MRILVVLALLLVPATALLSPTAARAEDPVQLPEIVITPATPSVRVFVARRRPEPRIDDLRTSFTSEIVASSERAPF
ncbi:MAG: hypothetical protein K1X94_05475 [Sandaracinaceae bacterium]|nr:hypothetical protein [Sandaracinaceae bacterium]